MMRAMLLSVDSKNFGALRDIAANQLFALSYVAANGKTRHQRLIL
jgi:hypothetical protein